jgi:poly-gamma-glutamate capsule biosynthesis protein CapA/YwtB (metallophosphatase superfamily)
MRELLVILIAFYLPILGQQMTDRKVLRGKLKIERTIPAPSSLLFRPDTISLTFMGDAMMHQEQIRRAYDKDSETYSFHEYLDPLDSLIRNADLAIANAEFTLAGMPYSGYPCFSAPDEYADYLRDSGIDIFLTANNHILDKGEDGLRRTLTAYSHKGIFRAGTALSAKEDSLCNPLMLAVRGVRIAFVNATYGTNVPLTKGSLVVHKLDSADVAYSMNMAKARGADLIIALPHWGTEYSLTHSRNQRYWAGFFVRHGADIVIGSHPHVVQDTQTIDGVPVIYSLGNIISNMSAKDTRIGLAVTLRIAVSESRKCTLLEPEYTFTWCARPGAISDGYKTVPVRKWLDKENEWKDKNDYINMSSSYDRVKAKTGISDI